MSVGGAVGHQVFPQTPRVIGAGALAAAPRAFRNSEFKLQMAKWVCIKCLVLPRCLYPPRTVSQTESSPSTARVGRKVMTRLDTREP